MITINDRIQDIINLATNGNASMFARMCDLSASIINSIIGGRKSEPSFSVLSKIYTVASKHGVSAHWLLTGEGKMIEEDLTTCRQVELSKKINEIRESLGLNISEFAKRVNISQGNMSAMLNNKRVIGEGIINKVCMELGVNKRYILTGESNTFSDSIVTINDCDKLKYTENDSLKYDHEKIKYRLTPPQVTEALACIFSYGLQKYKKEGSWKQVDKERYQDALMRHFQDYLKGNKIDESGFPHSFHVLWNAGALVFKDLEEMKIDTKENLWTHFNSKKE